GARGRMAALGVVAFPLAAVLLVAYHLHGHTTSTVLGWRLQLHAWLALLAYATLAIAALLALMLRVQERALRRRTFSAWLRSLPPLTELESLLFRTIGAGFALLSLTLLTGVLFVEDFLSQHLVHKSVLSMLSWLVFGGLLLGRWRYGWRGVRAVRWTLTAMVLLLLAFFGSKFVLNLVHGRPWTPMRALARLPIRQQGRGFALPRAAWLVLAAAVALLAAGAPAPPPDAGQVQRQADRALAAPPPPPPAAATSADPAGAGPQFEVHHFRLEGVTLLPEDTLHEALAPWRRSEARRV